ncbi:MAG: HAD family hydrolase [Proteobacteria bacterium]|nr:MAG: HAD family hydrolase [Pseudomonadota bacterium]
MLFRNVKSIIFDLDDTLIPSSRYYPLAVAMVLQPDKNWKADWSIARSRVKADLPNEHTSARNRLLYFKAYLEYRSDTERAAIDLYEKYEAELSRLIIAQAEEKRRFLVELSKSFNLYVLTNETTRAQLAKIKALTSGNTKIFAGIVTSEEVGFEKPSIKIFETLMRRYQLVSSECLFVGDSITNDLEPASALGMYVLHTTEFCDTPIIETGYARINELTQLRSLIP